MVHMEPGLVGGLELGVFLWFIVSHGDVLDENCGNQAIRRSNDLLC